MLTISQRLTASAQPTVQSTRPADARLVLPYDLRSRSRFRAQLPGGEQVGVILERGHLLRGGDRLLADDGRVIEVAAAPETVSVVHGADPQLLARAAYHLGNRHVMLQIGEGWLRYQHDHVLDDMVRGLGLNVGVEQAPFEPEAGAYAADGGHTHAMQGHAHGHGHTQSGHDHDH
ncbi:MAG TPA: urease accessory protein UreE [Steroidobacteraceae bacterium]|jgi:urease accessory protein|nr:urease accessory protein UreE [Steroidobacteraceae bacterium]